MMGIVASTEAARCRIWFASFSPPVTVNPVSPSKLLVTIFVPSVVNVSVKDGGWDKVGEGRTAYKRWCRDEFLDAIIASSSVQSPHQCNVRRLQLHQELRTDSRLGRQSHGLCEILNDACMYSFVSLVLGSFSPSACTHRGSRSFRLGT